MLRGGKNFGRRLEKLIPSRAVREGVKPATAAVAGPVLHRQSYYRRRGPLRQPDLGLLVKGGNV